MAVGDRSRSIRANVMGSVGDRSGRAEAQLERVYDSINRIQNRLVEESECLESQFDLIVVPEQEKYSLPSDFLRERILIPESSSVPLQQISLTKLDILKRRISGSDISDSSVSDIFYYYKWASQIGFVDFIGQAPSSEVTVTLYYWRNVDPVTEVISDSLDPVLDRRWDTALFYGAVAEIRSEAKWWSLFETEVLRQKRVERSNQAEPGVIPVNREYD